MKKTLLISYFFPPEIGGIQNYLYHFCQGLEADKIVVLVNRNDKDKELEFDKKQNFKIYREKFFAFKLIKPSWLFLFFKILKIIKREKIEFLQFGHYHQFCFVGLIYKFLFNLPYLIYFHGIDLFIVRQNKIKILLFKLITKKAKILIANSNFIKNELIKFGIENKKIEVVTPGVDYKKFDLCKKNEEIIKKYNLENKKIILSIGRLIKIKGFDLVIKVMPDILKEMPNLVYLIIGNSQQNNYRAELEKLISKLNLKNNVFLLGKVEDKEDLKSGYYNLAELVVAPSREIKYKKYFHAESFGIVSLEAQAMRKPVIAANVGGLSESISDQETGILFPPENIKILSLTIIKLLKNKELILKMGENGRKRIEKEFDWQKRIEKLNHILKNRVML